MRSALIGHTGFVGGNLIRQTHFDDCYNSQNIEEIAGRGYELLVCAGAPAEKWKANQDPLRDAATLSRLTGCLERVAASFVVLISTVDVYPTPVGVDEETVFDPEAGTPYGKHRARLERFILGRFNSTVVRLPALFGDGIKKNVVYDLLHDNCLDQIHADSVFQFYSLDSLWRDIQTLLQHRLTVVNFATEPVSVSEVSRTVFDRDFENRPARAPVRYDFRTRHAHLFGGSAGYIYRKEEVLGAMKAFVARRCGPRS